MRGIFCRREFILTGVRCVEMLLKTRSITRWDDETWGENPRRLLLPLRKPRRNKTKKKDKENKGPCCILLSQWFGFHSPAKGKGYITQNKGTGVNRGKCYHLKRLKKKREKKGSFSKYPRSREIYMAGFGYTTGATTLSSSSSSTI